MKVSIDQYAVIDLDAPVLPAYEVVAKSVRRWPVWCKHCREWHRHGPGAGHREAHCSDSSSPYWRLGYNLAYAGKRRDSSHIT